MIFIGMLSHFVHRESFARAVGVAILPLKDGHA